MMVYNHQAVCVFIEGGVHNWMYTEYMYKSVGGYIY